MARGVYSGSNYFLYSSGFITAPPLSMSAWIFGTPTSENTICGIYYTGGAGSYKLEGHAIRIKSTTYLVSAYSGDGTATSENLSSSAVNSGAWNQVGAVFASTASRIAYLNGAANGEQTTSRVANNADKVGIGIRMDNNNAAHMQAGDLYICEVGFWNVALTAADMLQLAAGYAPIFVKPESLVAYYPLIRGDASGDEPDPVGGYKMVEQGTVAVRPHAPVRKFFLPIIIHKAGGLAGRTANLSTTLDSISSTLLGASSTSAILSKTLDDTTSSSIVTNADTAKSTSILDNISSSASGNISSSASLGVVLGSINTQVSGAVSIGGSSSGQLGDSTPTGLGQVGIVGTSTNLLSDVTLSSSVLSGAAITGTLDITLAALVLVASGIISPLPVVPSVTTWSNRQSRVEYQDRTFKVRKENETMVEYNRKSKVD